MGHAVGYLIFKKDTPKATIIAECNDWEYRNKDLQESKVCTAGDNVEFYDSIVYDTQRLAEQALEKMSEGKFYPQLAVLYRNSGAFLTDKWSSKLLALHKSLKTLETKYVEKYRAEIAEKRAAFDKKYSEEEKNFAKKGKVFWLVRLETHC